MTVEERLERLERLNQQIKWTLVAVVSCVLALVVLSGQSAPRKKPKNKKQPQTIKATKFVLVDERGKTLASLKKAVSGAGASLVFYQGRRKTVEVGTPGGQSGIALWHRKKEGKLSLMLSSNREGAGFLELHDEEGHLKGQ